jgi:hypothetical protein
MWRGPLRSGENDANNPDIARNLGRIFDAVELQITRAALVKLKASFQFLHAHVDMALTVANPGDTIRSPQINHLRTDSYSHLSANNGVGNPYPRNCETVSCRKFSDHTTTLTRAWQSQLKRRREIALQLHVDEPSSIGRKHFVDCLSGRTSCHGADLTSHVSGSFLHVTLTVSASVVTGGAGTTVTMLAQAGGSSGLTVPANTGIDLTNATQVFASGTGTAIVYVGYSVVPIA